MIEQIIQFGAGFELTGVLTNPEISHKKTNTAAVLLLNPGFIHKVGINRFNTDIARLLALSGFSSLRFDLHGIGDSAKFNGKGAFDTQALIDTKDAIDILLEKSNVKKCILIGFCSGADYAHTAAVNDNRVSGIALLDAYAFPTLGFYLRYYSSVYFNPQNIFNFIRKKIRALFSLKKALSTNSNVNTDTRTNIRAFTPKKQTIKEVQQLIDRDTLLYYIYSGGLNDYYNYAGQFRAMFRDINFKGKVSHSFLKEADHNYTLLDSRNKLISMTLNWIITNF